MPTAPINFNLKEQKDEQPQQSTSIGDTPRKKKLKMRLQLKNKQIKKLHSQKRHLRKKVAGLKEILNTLTRDSLISKEECLILNSIGVEEKELLNRQLLKHKTGNIPRTKYSAELRSFALNLHFYSPKAYRYVRKTFGTCLPAPRTLTKWYSTIDGQPGFTKEALVALKLRAESHSDKKIYCSLVIDEMKIKHLTEYVASTRRHYGYVDFGFESTSDTSEEATDALVFLLVGINTTWKLPIGYFLVKGVKATLKAELVTQALRLVHETGVEIKALTCDGTRSNVAMAEELGCCFTTDKLQTTILDPQTGQQIYFFLDACHMLKLVRNAFEHYDTFTQSKTDNYISWSYIKKMHELQESELFYMANKLKANHVYFKSKIMNVRLAAQLFSTSVADALIFCNGVMELSAFANVEPTANFLKLMNDLFDILDSKTWSNGFKQALNKQNYARAFKKLDEAKSMLLNLEINMTNRQNISKTVNVLQSPRSTGFLGLVVCIESAKRLFTELVLTPNAPLTYLPLHKTSQDHIEIFFSVIRSHGGYSDNPSARQFEAIYKRLLVHTELVHNETGTNCIPLEKISILNCTSAVEKINSTTKKDMAITVENSEEFNFESEIETQIYLSPFGEKVVEYIAGFVVFSALKKIKCMTCIKGLCGQPNKESLTYQKSRGGLKYASNEVTDLCRLTELEIRKNLTDDKKVKRSCTTECITNKVLKNFVGKQLFPNIEEHYFDNEFAVHNIELAKVVIEKYANTRISYLSKKTDPKKCIRHIYTKLIHFKNQ